MAESELPYGFARPLAVQVRNLVRQQGQTGGEPTKNLENRRVAIAKTPSDGIPARSGTTPGSATVTLCQIDGTGAIATTSITETAYNIGGTPIEGEIYVPVSREYIGGTWIVVDDKPTTCAESPITDIRVSGSMLQYKQCGEWVTWHTGTDCPS
jgi:hypothetical protein